MHECAPHKDVISRAANMTSASWRYLLSFGGKNGAAPYMSALLKAEERAAQEQAFADGFLARCARTLTLVRTLTLALALTLTLTLTLALTPTLFDPNPNPNPILNPNP